MEDMVRRGQPASLDDVARELGVSRRRASQIEKAALRKAYKVCQARGLTPEDLFDELDSEHRSQAIPEGGDDDEV